MGYVHLGTALHRNFTGSFYALPAICLGYSSFNLTKGGDPVCGQRGVCPGTGGQARSCTTVCVSGTQEYGAPCTGLEGAVAKEG